jgi:hypothetical protein
MIETPRYWLGLAITVLLAVTITLPGAKTAPPHAQHDTLLQYATATWRSFVALTEHLRLPADNIHATTRTRAPRTKPTNIAAYLWAILAARDLEIITSNEACERIGQTLEMLGQMEHHAPSGLFYDWYDPMQGKKLTVWPDDARPLAPFVSSVDNAWLATALMMIRNSEPAFHTAAKALVDRMNFGVFYDPEVGQLRGGFWDVRPAEPSVPSTIKDHNGKDHAVFFTPHHYGTLNSETRIASYIGIARGHLPDTHYFHLHRTFPLRHTWQEMQPEAGSYRYRGMPLVPSWSGTMFEALMVPLFVPEEQWAPKSWGVNHPRYVRAQIVHGVLEALYGYWGFSPSMNPSGGYREYGVDAIGMHPDSATSNNDNTLVDAGFAGHRPAQPTPPVIAYRNGVVTPHAAFLALDFAPAAAWQNLANLRLDFRLFGWGGFYDAVNVETGEVAQYYLALDQGMIMVAIANALLDDRLQAYFIHGEIQEKIQPLLERAQEDWSFQIQGSLDNH